MNGNRGQGYSGTLPKLSEWAAGIELTPLQRALAATSAPGILSLAMGLPDSRLFPTVGIADAATRVMSSNQSALQYTLPCPSLKEKICEFMLTKGVDCSPDCIFLTHGAQQAINLLSILLLGPNSSHIEEELSYPGFQYLTHIFRPTVLTVPSDAIDGIDINSVERLLMEGECPALMYVMPNAHNPLGVTISTEKRRQLARLALQFKVAIVEDDPYGSLSYDAKPLPSIRSFESNWVYYVGSFSKILGPSLRIGWIVAPEEHVPILSVIKEGHDLNVSTLSQWIADDFLGRNNLFSHISTLNSTYRERRASMGSALREYMPPGIAWETPACGVFFWIVLPENMDASELLTQCIREEQVAFLPAQAFSRGKRKNGMRLNFSHCEASQIVEGVRRIGRVLCKQM